MGRLDGKVCIVTGGAKGLGQAMAETFAREGANVIACDVMPLTYECKNVEWFKVNVASVEDCKAVTEHAMKKFGHIDVLVNNAGVTRDALTHKMTDEMWDTVIGINLKGPFNMVREIGPKMMEAGKGSIISISSVVGEYGNVGQANYAATKSGLFAMTKSWAKEFARKGAQVRANTIAPGYTMTDILKTVPEALLNEFKSRTMLGRLGEPQDIANAALFLASDEACYVTGTNLSVNGGMRL